MRNLWILNHYAQEPSAAGGTRHFHFGKYLSNYNWQPTIIASSFDSVTGHQRLESNKKHKVEIINDVCFLWVKTPKYMGNGIGRIINMLVFSLRVLFKSTTTSLKRPDLVIGSSVHPFAALSAALIARRYGVPFVFEVRDLWPQTLIDMGHLRENSIMTWLLRRLESWLYHEASSIVVLLPYACKYIVSLGNPNEKVFWIPNGVDLSLFPNPTPPLQKKEFTLMYFGAHGQANDLQNILFAMRELQEMDSASHIKLRLIGEGPLKTDLINQAKRMSLKNVSFEKAVSKNKIPELANQADAFVIAVLGLKKLYQFGISMNKLFDYMAAMRPVIIASNASNNPIEEAQSGFTVPPGNPKALAEAILELDRLSFSERNSMAASGRAYVEKNHNFEYH
jgi:glycosyltransferase involved in cell wall biosynthesis